MAKEKCAKESQRHGDSGKKALIAHFDGGARYVARTLIGKISLAIVRAPNSPFSAVKMGGPFSLRCLSPLCSPAVGAGQTQMAVLGMLRCGLDGFASQGNKLDFYSAVGAIPILSNSAAWMLRSILNISATKKTSMKTNPRWPLLRAMRPVAEWRSFLLNYRGTTPDPRAVAPVVPRR